MTPVYFMGMGRMATLNLATFWLSAVYSTLLGPEEGARRFRHVRATEALLLWSWQVRGEA